MVVLYSKNSALFQPLTCKRSANLLALLREVFFSHSHCEKTVSNKSRISDSVSSMKNKVTRVSLVLFLLCTYFSVTLFGNVFRFSPKEGSFGIGTILLCAMVVLTFTEAVKELFKQKLWFALLLLLAWCSFSSLFGDWKTGYYYLLHLAIYLLFAAGLSTLRFTLKNLNILFLVIIISLLISSALTSFDFTGIVDIPYFNDFTEGVRTADNINIVGASGPFLGRNYMCAYFGPLLSVIAIFGFLARHKVIQVLAFVSLVSGLTSLFISFNRAAPLAFFVSILLFCVFSANPLRTKARVFAGSLLAVFVSLLTIYLCFPNQMTAIKYKVNLTLGVGNYREEHFGKQRKADLRRIEIAKETTKNIATHQFGHGLTSIKTTVNGKKICAHNNITQILWATGFFGFLWIPFFVLCIIQTFRKVNLSHLSPYEGIKYGLLAWFLISLMHVNWATGIMWALLGIYVSRSRKETKALPSISSQEHGKT
jgi:hypothetical protein